MEMSEYATIDREGERRLLLVELSGAVSRLELFGWTREAHKVRTILKRIENGQIDEGKL